MRCTCLYLKLNGERVGAQNWHPECPEHGLKSEWFKSPEQVAKREAFDARLREVQGQVRAARQRARGEL